MTEQGAGSEESTEVVPLGQRLFDNPILLLVLGIVVMLVFYTGWGLWEILTLPEATLP
jgi:hypothetical protein